MGTPLGPKYIPYTYMDPLGTCSLQAWSSLGCEGTAAVRILEGLLSEMGVQPPQVGTVWGIHGDLVILYP